MTDKQYVVRFGPGGERLIVNAGNARTAMRKGYGIASFLEITSTKNGLTVCLATEADLIHEDNVYPAPLTEAEIGEHINQDEATRQFAEALAEGLKKQEEA